MNSQKNMNQSETDQITSTQPPQEPRRCENGCGFFGSESTMNLCSKCYRDFTLQANFEKLTVEECPVQSNLMKQESGSNTISTSNDCVNNNVNSLTEMSSGSIAKNRCSSCRKRVGLLGFNCRCGNTFCSIHRYPEEHSCNIDFKTAARDAIAKANPLVKADKLQRIV